MPSPVAARPLVSATTALTTANAPQVCGVQRYWPGPANANDLANLICFASNTTVVAADSSAASVWSTIVPAPTAADLSAWTAATDRASCSRSPPPRRRTSPWASPGRAAPSPPAPGWALTRGAAGTLTVTRSDRVAGVPSTTSFSFTP